MITLWHNRFSIKAQKDKGSKIKGRKKKKKKYESLVNTTHIEKSAIPFLLICSTDGKMRLLAAEGLYCLSEIVIFIQKATYNLQRHSSQTSISLVNEYFTSKDITLVEVKNYIWKKKLHLNIFY